MNLYVLPGKDTRAASATTVNAVMARIIDWVRQPRHKVGMPLPPASYFAAELGVSTGLVHRAFTRLTEKGYIHRLNGIGPIIADKWSDTRHVRLLPIEDVITQAGFSCMLRLDSPVRLARAGDPTPPLPPPRHAQLYTVAFCHLASSVPVQYTRAWVDAHVFPGVRSMNPRNDMPSAYLSRISPDIAVETRISSEAAPDDIAQALDIAVGDPCITILSTMERNGAAVVQEISYCPGSRVTLPDRISIATPQPRQP